MAKEYDLIQTENPYVDRVVYYLKNLASGCVLKNPTEVLNNETIESLRNADLYTHSIKGELTWLLLDLLDEVRPTVDKTALGRTSDTGLKTYYDEIIDAYIVDQRSKANTFWSSRLVSPYIDFLSSGSARVGNIEYTELNGENGLITYLESFRGKQVDGHPSLTYESSLYTHITMVQSGRHNLLLIPRDETERISKNNDGSETPYSDYSKGYAINSNEAEQERFLLFAMDYIVDHYVERNNYYRMLSGKPNLSSEDYQMQNRIFLGISSVQESYSVKYDNEKYVDVFNEFNDATNGEYVRINYDLEGKYNTLFGKTYIDELSDDQIQVLKNYKVIDNLLDAIDHDWNYKYLNFLGSDSVDPIKARSTVDFGYLHINSIDNDNIYNRFKDRLDLNRIFVIRTIYSEAYKYGSDFYDHFICILIIILSMVDIITLLQEIIVNKEVLDQRIIKYIFESNGVPYYSEIPLNYQINMVKNLNTLIKYKSSNRNIVDICSLFGFDNIEVFKYYLLKIRNTDEDGNFIPINEDKLNLDSAYDLKFIKVPYDGNVTDYINDKEAEIEYEKMISGDPTWNAGKSIEYVKQQILEKEFNIVKSKYISIDSTFDIADATTQIAYLMDIMYVDKEQEDGSLKYLCKQITVPFQNVQIPIGDMFLYLFALTFAYYGTKSATNTEFGYNASVLGKSITGTAYNTNSRSERYLALDINQDLARLATLMQAKLNKNIVVSTQTYSIGDTTETRYLLQLSGISKTFELSEEEYDNMIEDEDHLYTYTSYGNEKIIQFTQEEIDDSKYIGGARPYRITHNFSSGEYDIIPLTKDEYYHYISDVDITKTFELAKEEYDNLKEVQYKYTYEVNGVENTICFTPSELSSAEKFIEGGKEKYRIVHYFKGGEYDETATASYPKSRMYFDKDDNTWRNIISIYYFEKNEYIGSDSFEPNTLYIVNNQTKRIIKYKHPVDPFSNVPDLYEFLNNDSNSSGALVNRELLQTAMIEAQSIEEYNMYKWVYDSIMISDRVKSYFATGNYNEDGTPEYYSTYEKYLTKYGVLAANLETVENMMKDTTMDDSVRKETVSTMINNAISALESVDFSKYFEFAYNGIATVSGDYLASYIIKLIEFFKSYKVDIYDINAVYKFDDKFNNTVIMIDQIDRISSSLGKLKDIHYDTYGEELSESDKRNISQILQVFRPKEWESPNGEAQTRNTEETGNSNSRSINAFLADKFNGHSAIFDILPELLKYKDLDENYHPELLNDEFDWLKLPSDILKYEWKFYGEDNITGNDNITFTKSASFSSYDYYPSDGIYEYTEIHISRGEIIGKDGYDTILELKNCDNYGINLAYYNYSKTPNNRNYNYLGDGYSSSNENSIMTCIIPNEINFLFNRDLEVDINIWGYVYNKEILQKLSIILYHIPVSYRSQMNPKNNSLSLFDETNNYNTYNGYIYTVNKNKVHFNQLTSKLRSEQDYYEIYAGELARHIQLIMTRTFGEIENVSDLINKLDISIGTSDFMNDTYTINDIVYFMVYYTTRIFLSNKVLTISKFEEETQTQATYISNTDNWLDPNWYGMSVEEREEFYKELEILDDIILNTLMPINDKYYDELNDEEKTTLKTVVKSLTSVLKLSSKDLYEYAATKDDMNFDRDTAEVYEILMNYDKKELYALNYLRDQFKQLISNLIFGKDTFKKLDISDNRLSGYLYTQNNSNCVKYITNPITSTTSTTLYPTPLSGSYAVYNYLPVDFTKYRYYYTGARSSEEFTEPSSVNLYFIGFYTDRWEQKYNTDMDPYKEMIYATNFKMLPTNYGFFEIQINESILEDLGFSISDIKYITFSMYNDSNFKLYRCLREKSNQDPSISNYINTLEYDSTADMVKIYDKFHYDSNFNIGEILPLSDLFVENSINKSVYENINLVDQIYIEEA